MKYNRTLQDRDANLAPPEKGETFNNTNPDPEKGQKFNNTNPDPEKEEK